MTAKRFAALKQELKTLSQLENGLFAAACAERALREAQTLMESPIADEYPRAERGLVVLWERLAAKQLAYDAEVRAVHTAFTDYIPRDPDEVAEALPQAWASAMTALSYAFMVLYKPEKAFEYAANGAGESRHLVATYYKDSAAMEEEEAKWQDRALALVRGKNPSRAEFAALPDYARGDFEEPG